VEDIMKIILNEEKHLHNFNKTSIFKRNTNKRSNSTMQFTDTHSLILYAQLKNSTFIKLSKNEQTNETLIFSEYDMVHQKNGYTKVEAEISIKYMLDFLDPNTYKEIRNFEKNRYTQNIIFKNEKELMQAYMQAKNFQLIRYCKPIIIGISTVYIIQYNINNTNCIKSIKAV